MRAILLCLLLIANVSTLFAMYDSSIHTMKRRKFQSREDFLKLIPLPIVGDGPYKDYPDVPTRPIQKNPLRTNMPSFACCGNGEKVTVYGQCRGCQRQLCQRCEIKRCYDSKRCSDQKKESFLMVRYCSNCTDKEPKWFFISQDKQSNAFITWIRGKVDWLME